MSERMDQSARNHCIEVKSGDTIWSLAEKVYGPGKHNLAAIYEENHLSPAVTTNGGKRKFSAPVIKPGDKLYLPAPARVAELEKEFFHHLGQQSLKQSTTKNPEPGLVTKRNTSDNSVVQTALKAAPAKQPNDLSQTKVAPEASTPVASNLTNTKSSDAKTESDTSSNEMVPKASSVLGPDTHAPAVAQNTETKTEVATGPAPGNYIQHESFPVPSNIPIQNSIANVAEICADGLFKGTITEGIKQSTEDPLGTLGRVGTAVAAGVAFGALTGGVGFVAEAAGAIGIGLTIAAGWDFLNPYDKRNALRNTNISNCVKTAWNAGDHTTVDKLKPAMETELGRPGFDLAIGLAAGAAGGVAGGRLGRAFTPHLDSPPGTSLLRIGTELPRLTGPDTHYVRALSIRDLSVPAEITSTKGGPRIIETTKGGAGPRLIEDRSITGKTTTPTETDADA